MYVILITFQGINYMSDKELSLEERDRKRVYWSSDNRSD